MKQNTIVTHAEHGMGKVIGYRGKTARAVRFHTQTIICPLSSLIPVVHIKVKAVSRNPIVVIKNAYLKKIGAKRAK